MCLIFFYSLQKCRSSYLVDELVCKNSPQPGIEPGSKAPEAFMLPLHHWGRSTVSYLYLSNIIVQLFQIIFTFLKLSCAGTLSTSQKVIIILIA